MTYAPMNRFAGSCRPKAITLSWRANPVPTRQSVNGSRKSPGKRRLTDLTVRRHRIYSCSYVEGVPLGDKKDALPVNFAEVTVTDRQTKEVNRRHAFVTGRSPEGGSASETAGILNKIIDGGRAGWKTGNENNNTLKTKGYHLEHNFGHGRIHLSALLATMNIPAFLFRTMPELMNEKYRLLRKAPGAGKRFFHRIRILLIYLPFRNFDHLMTFMSEEPKEGFGLRDLKVPISSSSLPLLL